MGHGPPWGAESASRSLCRSGAPAPVRPGPAVLQVTVWPLYPVPALVLFLAPVGFASGKGKVKEPDEQGSRPSKAPQA